MMRKSLEKNVSDDIYITDRVNIHRLGSSQKVPVQITACINDTTGTLMASHYVDPRTRIGIIFGTGCNAAYVETVKNIPKIAHLGLPPEAQVAINCEWGAWVS